MQKLKKSRGQDVILSCDISDFQLTRPAALCTRQNLQKAVQCNELTLEKS